jgi:Protein of unknown function (DUF2924)
VAWTPAPVADFATLPGRSRQARRRLPRRISVKPGTVLTRERAGTTHKVLVLEQGFRWNGQTWASLSEIATKITGTRWSGPRFFGLKRRNDK